MSETVICFENVSKKYKVGSARSSLREQITYSLKHPFNKDKQFEEQDFWALKNVSFEVKKGQSLGIIGPNGAGKSTILKILSSITEPTSGKVSINGRMASLIEVGAGFHPELTGAENIYLNGNILGLRKKEIDEKFDDIVRFAGLEKFINTSVKHYSSGMYVRLGFAVAVHTDPEILLVDEVLAVGDMVFQEKCRAKMREKIEKGTTLILISHNISAIKEICNNSILLYRGEIASQGESTEVIEKYHNLMYPPKRRENISQKFEIQDIEITDVKIFDKNNEETSIAYTGDPLHINITFNAKRRIPSPEFGIKFYLDGTFEVTGPNTLDHKSSPDFIEGVGTIQYKIDSLPLLKGNYLISVYVWNIFKNVAYDEHVKCYELNIFPSNNPINERHGIFAMRPSSWIFKNNLVNKK